jgi:uncharacterized coiled-coil protein SlyX
LIHILTVNGLPGGWFVRGFAFMDTEFQHRLEKIGTNIAFLERQVEEMNEVLVDHVKTIGRLKEQLRRQGETIENFEMERIKNTNPKPPHYQ